MDESTPLLSASGVSSPQPRLNFRVRLGYALGHAQNDLCGAMYFSYLLVYLEGTGLNPVDAGVVLIAGQIVDGMATPVVGYFSDHFSCFSDSCCWGLAGRRKAWYMGGLALVTSTFWVLFTPFPDEEAGFLESLSPVLYYSLANCLFQVGWASVPSFLLSLSSLFHCLPYLPSSLP